MALLSHFACLGPPLACLSYFIRRWVVLTLIGQVSVNIYLSSKKINPLDKDYWMRLVLSPAIEICCCSFLHLLIVHVNVYIQQLEIWATALLEEMSNIDSFSFYCACFFYSKETISITVKPWLFNKVLDIMNNFFYPSQRKVWKRTLI